MKIFKNLSDNYKIVFPILIFVVYLQVFTFDLTDFMDNDIIINNYSRISDFSNFPNEFVKSYPGTNQYKPILMLSYYINASLTGQSIYSYQLFNLLMLIFLSFTMFYLFRLLSDNKQLSFWITIIFIVHPVITPNVVWLPGREHLISSTFGLLSFYLFLVYFKTNKNTNLFYSAIAISIALFTSFSSVVFLILELLFAIIYHKSEFKRNFGLISAVFFSILLIYSTLYILFISNHNFSSDSNILPNNGLIYQIGYVIVDFSRIENLTYNLGNIIFPLQFGDSGVLYSIKTLLGVISLITIGYIVFKSKPGEISLIGLSLLILIILSMVLRIQDKFNISFEQQNEFSILIMVSVLLIISGYVTKFSFQYRNTIIGIVIFVPILIVSNYFSAQHYSSTESFYSSKYLNNQSSPELFNLLVEVYIKKGNISEAEKVVKASKLDDKLKAKSWIMIGNYYYNLLEYHKASQYLEKALIAGSNNVNAIKLLSNSYLNSKEFSKSVDLLLPLTSQPEKFPEAKWDLLNVLFELKDFVGAEKLLKEKFSIENDKIRCLQIIDLWSKFYYKEPDNAAVVKVMKLGLIVDPENAIILNYIIDTYKKVGLNSKASEYEIRLKRIYNKKFKGK